MKSLRRAFRNRTLLQINGCKLQNALKPGLWALTAFTNRTRASKSLGHLKIRLNMNLIDGDVFKLLILTATLDEKGISICSKQEG